MHPPTPRRSNRLLSVVILLLSLHFAIAYRTMTADMVSFATRVDPSKGLFAYRMLPTLLWEACAYIVRPLHLHWPRLQPPFTSDVNWFIVLLTFASMLGTLFVGRGLIASITSRPQMQWLTLGLGYAAYFDYILVLNRNVYYPYDILGLFLFSLLVYLAWLGRPVLFALLFPFAFLNKETVTLTILIYFGFHVGRVPLTKLLSFCAVMTAMVICLRWIQHSIFCPSCPMAQDQLSYNVHQLANPLFWISVASVFGFGYVPLLLFWRNIPTRVRLTCVIVFAVWAVGMAKVGILREIRIFSELSILILLMTTLAFATAAERALALKDPA